MEISAREITKRFNNIEYISNISFTSFSGEIVGILAPRGSGKTLLLNMLSGKIQPDSGSIEYSLDGEKKSAKQSKKNIGFLLADNPLYPNMTVFDSIDFSAELYNLPRYQKRNRAQNLIKNCGLSKYKHKYITELSKGQRQRVGIAQALVNNPPFLLLDEPVTELDPVQSEQLYEIIRECGKERCVLLTSSRMRDMEAMCDTMLVLSEGKILAKGTVEELQQEVANSSILEVKIAGQSSEFVQQELEKIEYAQIVRRSGLSFDIHTTQEERFARDLFDLCVENGCYILRFVSAKKSLEDIFKQLRKS